MTTLFGFAVKLGQISPSNVEQRWLGSRLKQTKGQVVTRARLWINSLACLPLQSSMDSLIHVTILEEILKHSVTNTLKPSPLQRLVASQNGSQQNVQNNHLWLLLRRLQHSYAQAHEQRVLPTCWPVLQQRLPIRTTVAQSATSKSKTRRVTTKHYLAWWVW